MPCRTIAVANQKGGTGKTATTLSLGMALAKSGQRVLLVDTDPQGDLTKSLGWKDPDALGTTIANHLNATIEGASLDPREGILPHEEGIDLMPANIELAGMEMPILMAMSREQLVNMWMSPLKADYDFIIFDCAPTLGIIPINAFVASDSVLVPVSAEYLPASAMTGLLKTVGRVRRQINPSLEVEGILLTLFDSRNNLACEVEETIREQYGSAYRVFDTVIPRAVSAAEAPSVGASIFAYDGRGKVASALPRRWSAVGRKKVPITLPGVDDLFTSQGERDGSAVGGVADIPLALIDPLPGHPFQVRDDEEMERLAESIAENGVLVPLTVRGAGAERYELVSGHRRKCAAELAGLESVPCIVRTMSDDEAVIAMVDSNLQREAILPSERAFAYSMRLEAKSYWVRNGDDTKLAKNLARWLEGEGGLCAYADEPIPPDLLGADGEPLDMVGLAQADPDFAKLWRSVETRRSVIRSQMAMGGSLPPEEQVLAACEEDSPYKRYLKVFELFRNPSARLERAREKTVTLSAMPFGGRLS